MRIDTAKIEGYASMTAEQKIAALESYNVELSDAGYVKKDVFDKTASELATWKHKYQDTLSDAEKAKLAADEAQATMQQRLAELERKDKIHTIADKYVASGFAGELALATATAFVDGDMDAVLENLSKHTENVKVALEDKVLKQTPTPHASSEGNTIAVDYGQSIADATSSGNYIEAAHLARLRAEKK